MIEVVIRNFAECGCSVAEPNLGDLDGLVVVPHGDEAGAEVEAQEGEVGHAEAEDGEAAAADQAQLPGQEASPAEGPLDAGQPPAARQIEAV